MTQSYVCSPAKLVWLLYDPTRVRKGIELITRITRLMPLERIVVVWNGNGAIPMEAAVPTTSGAAVEVIKGNNHGREFGGYQDGLDHLQRNADGGVYFLNDTAGVHNYLPQFFINALVSAATRLRGEEGVCVGHVDRALQLLEINGLRGDSWIRSNLFYLDTTALQSLDWTVYSPEINVLIPGDATNNFYSATLGLAMQERINRWLFQPGKMAWYAAAPLTDENLDLMTGKARSILQEYYFSLRIARAGIKFSRTDMSTLQVLWLKLINRIGRVTGHLK